MIQLASYEFDELRDCQHKLAKILAVLDNVGAGIAAIHVNAAIEQLNCNMAALQPNAQSSDPLFFVKEDRD